MTSDSHGEPRSHDDSDSRNHSARGTTQTLTAVDGHSFSAFRVEPTAAARGAVIVLQEIFGVNAHLRRVCEGFAAEGYVALAPALFDRAMPGVDLGYQPDDVQRGRGLRATVGLETMLLDVRAAAKALRDEGLKVAVVGYCMGGVVAWLSATRIEGLSAVVGYYGDAIASFANEQPRCPIALHFGETDRLIPPEHWTTIQAAHPALPLYTYPAGHAFSNDDRPTFHAPSAALARQRTLDFLAKHLS